MKLLYACLMLLTLAGTARAETPRQMLERADKLRAEKSFAMARKVYDEIAAMTPASEKEIFDAARVWGADCLWRERTSPERTEEASKRLEALVAELPDNTIHAEAAESLGDLLMENRPWEKIQQIVDAWSVARDFWGKSTEAGAGARYIALNFKLAEMLINRITPIEPRRGGRIPPQPQELRTPAFETVRDALQNILRVTKEPAERAHTLLLMGQAWLRLSSFTEDKDEKAKQLKEAENYLRQACAVKPDNEWTAQALWDFGDWLNSSGRYVEAVKTWQEILDRFQPGKVHFYDAAKRMIEEMKRPTLDVRVAEAFAPGSYIHVNLGYRNLAEAKLYLKRADAGDYISNFKGRDEEQEMAGKVVQQRAVEGLVDEGKYIPHTQEIYLDPLEPAVYQVILISPKLGKPVVSQPFIVSALAVAAKIDGAKGELFVTDADSGAAVKGAAVEFVLGERTDVVEVVLWHRVRGKTDANGRATLALPEINPKHSVSSFAFARRGGEVAIAQSGYVWRGRRHAREDGIRLYAYTDRPAYRPGEEINWKAIVRRDSGEDFSIPDAASYTAIIRDERGAVVHTGVYKPGEFGTLSGKLTLDRTAALGILRIELLDEKQKGFRGSAALCRLEEYKLPEYKVAVEPGAGPYRMGSAVPFSIKAEYYFGGPVAGASAEVVVYRAPFWRNWGPIVPYEWLYDGEERGWGVGRWPRYAPEEVVMQKKVTLDADGKADVEIGALSEEEVKAARDNEYWGYTYRVEARVTDLSRREVSASGTVKVGLTAFAAYLNPERYLYLPGDKVKINLRTLDPNNKPVAAEGTATIYKREWVPGNAKKDADREIGDPRGKYKDTELFKKPAVTGADGEAVIDFQPDRDGFYLVKYTALDAFEQNIEGETTVFVAGKNTTALGYRSGGAEIIIDRSTYEQGETIQALVVTRRPGVAVWFGVEGTGILSQQVVKMKGTAQLVPIKVEAAFTPNVYLTSVAMHDYSAFRDIKMVRVPPVNELLDVKVISDKAEYRPGETANVRVEARDHNGKPVRAELSLGVADAAVWAIQSDLAQDIRKFFWGRTRPLQVQTASSPEQYGTEFWKPKKDDPGKFERVLREEIPEQEGYQERYRERRVMSRGDGAFFFEAQTRGSTKGAMSLAAAPSAWAPTQGLGQDRLQPAEPRVRTNFGSTAYWMASVVTDQDGNASASFTMPDSLTSWRAASVAITKTTQVGQATHEVKTNKPIMVRPQAPRFFVQGDTVTLSAIVTNNTSATQMVQVRIDTRGLNLDVIGGGGRKAYMNPAWRQAITSPVVVRLPQVLIAVPANNQRRVDWTVTALTTGTATIKMTALADVDSDAAEKTYPVLEYGIEQFIAKATSFRDKPGNVTLPSGSSRKDADREIGVPGETSRTLTLSIPAERREGSEALTIWIEPTLARAMVNALPYLAGYPYGCTEQTLSRFVPAVITAKVLQQLQIENKDLEKKLPKMIKAGLDRLYDFQHADGGWGWWKEGSSDPYMTAYVVQGLAQALEADVSVKKDVLRRAANYLSRNLVKYEESEDTAAWMLYALATVKGLAGEDALTAAAHEKLWPRREKLNPYTRALFALACQMSGRGERAKTLARNMMNGLNEDKQNGTASWGETGFWWRWSDGSIEATAFSMRALLAIEPDSPVVDEAMTWLVRNRRGSRWESTKDTAIVIRALADYIQARGEDKPDWSADVVVNGKVIDTLKATPQTVFSFEGKVTVPAGILKSGDNTVTIVRKGTGALYASAWLTYFTREERIKSAGNEVFAERKYFRTEMKPTPSGVYTQVRTELKEGDVLKSGERVEVELSLEAKNNYEYVVIEDLKAAGTEAVQLQSGGMGTGTIWGHQEMRDEKTAFFIDSMPQGKHTIKYELRAEVPGVFHAMPCLVHAMYVPEIRANSTNAVIKIE
ncbi:MAG: alpha-2-macroglobulin family protein [Candidatus Sumerlaeia bacterium]